MSTEKQTLNALLRSDLAMFIHKTFQTVSPNDTYEQNWHIHAIAHVLTQVADGEVKRLIINVPPRHMKTISVAIAFVAWMLGHNPKHRIVCASYSQELSTTTSHQTRMVLESPWYQECFKGTRIGDSKNTQTEFWTTEQGYRLATSVGGTLTGRGASILIIDDPLKAEDAQSQSKRQQVIDWYQNTAATRLDNPKTGAIIVIQQRLHEADLAGALLANGGWTHLNLPAIAEQDEEIPISADQVHVRQRGDVLHEARLSRDDLDQIQQDIGSYNFAGQYQQRPAPAGGGIVKLKWFKRYTEAPQRESSDLVVQSWDFAFTTKEYSDFTVCLTFLLRRGRMHLIDLYRKQVEATDLMRVIQKVQRIHQANLVLLEEAGASLMIARQLREYDPYIYKVYSPQKDKELRLAQYAPVIQQGRVYLPESAPWLLPFERELESFPNGKHDDQVDALSQFLNHAHTEIHRRRSRMLLDGGDVYDDDGRPYRLPSDDER